MPNYFRENCYPLSMRRISMILSHGDMGGQKSGSLGRGNGLKNQNPGVLILFRSEPINKINCCLFRGYGLRATR